MNMYMHKDSHNHPAQKRLVMHSPGHQARTIADLEHLEAELKYWNKCSVRIGIHYNRFCEDYTQRGGRQSHVERTRK